MKNFPGGMQQFLKQAQQMQGKMAKLQEELATKTVEATSGGGAVTAVATGAQLISAIKISKDVVDPNDLDMLQDLVLTAVNESLKKSKAMSESEMQKITGGVSMPGLF
ncbi:MAG: YbaB/EbfC family nucleoid-associated protein [Oligoflexia bacterium]|nr:YbaB/EbfC family nucleoid-associated protein [Oligoflexia bacterium]